MNDERLKDIHTSGEIIEYGNKVRNDIVAFLNSGNNAAFDREVHPATAKGESSTCHGK
ncbi:hypothetical protein IH785_15755 [candidate division KSB1 bacterium]|nr:hypothetical protein [candidate division KSB1 bacterium]